MEQLQLQDIYGVWYKPFWQQTWFIVSGIIISATLLCIVAYWIYKKHNQESEPEAWQVALAQLNALQKNETQTPKLFYIQLTAILKQYLQNRYGLSLVGTTDDELVAVIQKNSEIPEAITQIIKELLNGVVLIKFANQKAADEQMHNAIKQSIALVQKTKITDQKDD